jgi:ribosome maturation factor RimP
VEVKLYAPLKGQKYFELKLVGFDEHTVELEDKGEIIRIEKTKIAKICRAIDFDNL